MTYRMSRTQWILTGLVGLLLVLMVGFLFLAQARQSVANGQEAVSGEFGAATVTPPPPLTAREGYKAALPTAQSWAEDAQLIRAQATWPPGSDLQAPAPSWTYTFYSANRGATTLVRANEQSTQLMRARPVSEVPDFVAVEEWAIDSPDAYKLLYASGGEAFLTIHPQRTMMLTLHANEPLRWKVDLIDEGAIGNAAGRQMLRLAFSAKDGRLIASPFQGDTNEAN